MFALTRVRIDDRLDALRPPPARLERVPADLSPGDVQQLHFGPVGCASLVRRAEVPVLQCCHSRPPCWLSSHTVATGSGPLRPSITRPERSPMSSTPEP